VTNYTRRILCGPCSGCYCDSVLAIFGSRYSGTSGTTFSDPAVLPENFSPIEITGVSFIMCDLQLKHESILTHP
jgi:hypothetical protein